jgi:hypothetical protein
MPKLTRKQRIERASRRVGALIAGGVPANISKISSMSLKQAKKRIDVSGTRERSLKPGSFQRKKALKELSGRRTLLGRINLSLKAKKASRELRDLRQRSSADKKRRK